jgi:cytochrome c oxidase subunit 2
MNLASTGSLDPRGPVAEVMADLYWLMLAIGGAVFLLFLVMLGIGLFRRPPEPADPDTSRRLHRWIVGGGVVLPFLVLLVVYAATVYAMRLVPDEAPDDALRVEVSGFQWRYEVSYPDHGITAVDELHVPVGRPVALRLTSTDVIHSFWVPELAGKLDMLPDGPNTLVIEADEPGRWSARCAEFCGERHATMQITVVAESPEEFEAWVAGQQ